MELFTKPIENWPHAICFIGNSEELLSSLRTHPVTHFEHPRLTVDDVRPIREVLHQKLSEGEHQVTVIETGSIGIAPQNAFLKSIEEPAAGHRIIFCLQTLDGILPTILSRVTVVHGEDHMAEQDRSLTPWLTMPILDRLKEAEKWLGVVKKAGTMGDFRLELRDMIIALEQTIYAAKDPKNHQYLSDLQNFRGYLQNPGASPKYILEFLALSLPTA